MHIFEKTHYLKKPREKTGFFHLSFFANPGISTIRLFERLKSVTTQRAPDVVYSIVTAPAQQHPTKPFVYPAIILKWLILNLYSLVTAWRRMMGEVLFDS